MRSDVVSGEQVADVIFLLLGYRIQRGCGHAMPRSTQVFYARPFVRANFALSALFLQ